MIKARILIAGILLAFSLAVLPGASLAAGGDMSIGRMRVMIWPEYDDSGVLIVYDGRFVEDSLFPAKTDFFIPKGVVINDVCSLSPGGQHFCQLYEIEEGKTQDIAHLSLPYSNFYLSFHTPGLDLDKEKREIGYVLKANHQIRSLELDIQQPLRSSEFTVAPSGGEVKERKGFNHYQYSLEGIAKGEEAVFNISYLKKDREPSVDIKYASMSGPRVWGSPYETQRNLKTIIYLVFGSGLAAAAGGIAWIVMLNRKKRKGTQ